MHNRKLNEKFYVTEGLVVFCTSNEKKYSINENQYYKSTVYQRESNDGNIL